MVGSTCLLKTIAGTSPLLSAVMGSHVLYGKVPAPQCCASISAEGFVKYDDSVGSEELRSTAVTASDSTSYLARFSTGVAGDKELYFNAMITSFEETAAVNEMATYSITLESTGAITEATISA